ncbi:hypothetical protein Nepgr_006027 [Nepenthes gracilis]|uniref:Uncharacterized protein n=1 Tax=Nepenthes gracilis TaxID=150966 RepID=A0AAD3S4E8_NEPGR|nr:hypothetical protein Nepgr_006027 [Nepenthes gracilis]
MPLCYRDNAVLLCIIIATQPQNLPTAEGANKYQRVVLVQLVGREIFEEQYTTISQWPPSRELIAKNIPDFEWKFKHPILDQIKRHLLTTDGSVFVEAKSLVAVPNCVSPERVREIANSLGHRSNQDVFLEAVVLTQLVENGTSNVSLARVPQTSSLDNDDIEGTDGGEAKHGTVFLDPEPQAIDVWPKELQQLQYDVKHPRVKLQARELPPPDWDYHAAHLLEAETQPQDFKGVSEALQPFDGEVKHCQPLGEDAESGQNPRDGHVLISGPELIPDSLPILEMQRPGHQPLIKQFPDQGGVQQCSINRTENPAIAQRDVVPGFNPNADINSGDDSLLTQILAPAAKKMKVINGDDCSGVLSSTRRRAVAEIVDNSSLILAEDRTNRRDPTDGFKHYRAWFVIFGLTLCFIYLCFCCCRREPYGYSRTCYALSLIFLMLFTIAAIIGCIVLYTGQGKFHTSTTNTLDYVVSQADETVNKLNSVSGYLAAAKNIGVGQFSLPAGAKTKINDIQLKINTSANTLAVKTHDNSKKIQRVLNIVRTALVVVAALASSCRNIYFMWCFSSSSQCGRRHLCCHGRVGSEPDCTYCLDDILPCVDNATAQEILLRSKDVTQEIISLIDTVIVNVSNVNYPPSSLPVYYNQSGPLVPALCNPFYADLSNRKCASGEVDFNNASEAWKNFVCQVSASNICTTTGRLTPSIYNQMISAVNISYGLYHYTPFMINLVDCSFVRSTFSVIKALARQLAGVVHMDTSALNSNPKKILPERMEKKRLKAKGQNSCEREENSEYASQ